MRRFAARLPVLVFLLELLFVIVSLGAVVFLLRSGRLAIVLGGSNSLQVPDQPVLAKIRVDRVSVGVNRGARILLQRWGGAPGDAVVAYTAVIPKGTHTNMEYPLTFQVTEEERAQIFQPGTNLHAILYGVTDLTPSVPDPDSRMLLFDWFGNRVADEFRLTQ